MNRFDILWELGGPDGEIGASMRYLSQRFAAPNRITAGTLTDVGSSVSKRYRINGHHIGIKRRYLFDK